MKTESTGIPDPSGTKTDFRAPTSSKKSPCAVADGGGGIIIAVAEVAGSPERVFRALTTNEVEQWWALPGVYRQKDWKADLRVRGPWSVSVQLNDGSVVHANGEFCEIAEPNKLVMTRNFDNHPFPEHSRDDHQVSVRAEPARNAHNRAR